MAKTRNQQKTAKLTAKAKNKSKVRSKKKLSEIRKCKECKKVFSTHSSLKHHQKKRFPCNPNAVEIRKKETKEKKRIRNAEDYKWCCKGYTLAFARKLVSGDTEAISIFKRKGT